MNGHLAVLENLRDSVADGTYLLTPDERSAITAAIALMRGQSEDRKALEYLMGQFDAEFHVCERCGHEDSTRDCDSAIYLRRHLGTMQQTNGGGE